MSLLETFRVARGDEEVELPPSVQRLIAILALQTRRMLRREIAESLWTTSTCDRASGSLRSALWRLGQCRVTLVNVTGRHVELADNVSVDVRDLALAGRRLINNEPVDVCELQYSDFLYDVLPHWSDEWLIVEREHFRQLRMRALEVLCLRLLERGRLAQSINAGLAAVACEPLRESANRALIRVHMVEGNLQEAVRQYQSFRDLLLHELALEPSPQMMELMRGIPR